MNAIGNITVIFVQNMTRAYSQPLATVRVDVIVSARYYPCKFDSNMVVLVYCIHQI